MPSQSTTSSAPGKIILFGEHAVVYGRPAIAAPVMQLQATATVTKSSQPGIWIEAPDIHLSSEISNLEPSNPLAATVHNLLSFLRINHPPDFTVQVKSSIPVAAGLGSGAAVAVAILRALAAFLENPLPDEQTSRLAFETEKLLHGTPSGIDNSVVTYARPVYFAKGQPVETLRVGASFHILIADSGVSALTKESVGDVRCLWRTDPTRWEQVFDQVGDIVQEARQAIEMGEIARLGALMDLNHALLQQMTVSSPAMDRLVEVARASGALGAKLSGGGRGGNLIALVDPEKSPAISTVLLSAGAVRTILTVISTN